MSQITTGIRSILSKPSVYDFMQNIMGAQSFREKFVSLYVKPNAGSRVLDLGCGTADILNFLPNVDYYGYDISKEYIESARRRFGSRGSFQEKILSEEDASRGAKFDIVLSLGVLHHLDDETARSLLRTAYSSLKLGGRFISHDPVFTPRQSKIARFLISKDRGQNVRTEFQYLDLIKQIFPSAVSHVREQTWIPYTHCFLEGVKS